MTMTDKPKGGRGKQIRVRVADRLEMLIAGEITVEDLDDEEVRRMQLRDKNGNFQGRPGKWIPRELAIAFQQEQFKRFRHEMSEMLPLALSAHKRLLTANNLGPGDGAKLQAVKETYERMFGKIPNQTDMHLVVDKGKTFEDFVGEALVDVEEEEPL